MQFLTDQDYLHQRLFRLDVFFKFSVQITPNMSVKYCSVTGCCSSTMLGRKKKLFFEIPKTEPLRRIWSKSDREINQVRYFCEDHFDPDDIQGDGNLKIFAAPVCNIPDVKSNRLVYSNRRKSAQLRKGIIKHFMRYTINEVPPYKLVDSWSVDNTLVKVENHVISNISEPAPYTLVDDGCVKNTVVNLVFHNFDEDESTYHEDINTEVHASEYTNQDEDDCIITNEISPTIIDLSDDTKNYSEESDNMIEVIICSDIEPDESQEKINDDEASEAQQLNSVLVTSSIDLTIEEGSPIIEIIGRDELIRLKLIDLTEELCSDEDYIIVDDTSTAIIEKIKQSFINKHPESLKSIQENREDGVLEIEISKDASFKSDEDFQQHLMKVVKLVQKSKREGEVVSESMEYEENLAADITHNKDRAFTLQKIKVLPLKRLQPTQNRILNKYSPLKSYAKVTARKEISESLPVICIDSENSDDNYDVHDTNSNIQSTQLIGNIREYNTNQILKRANSYMGVSTESLQMIENLVSDCFKIKYALILLLRKIKLNESFSTLSDVLCWNRKYCKDLYQTLLPKLSNTLSCLLHWPTNCRESRGIADIFEIEIEKPNDFVEQNLSFCVRRKRYFVKLLISITNTGYITYVSVPFYTIQSNTLDSCLPSIQEGCSTLAVNPILMNCLSTEGKSPSIVPFDSNSNADRHIIEIVFQKLRRFAAVGEIVDTKSLKFVRHKVVVVASLCNLNLK